MLHKVGKLLAWASSAASEPVETLGAGKRNPLGSLGVARAAGAAAETFSFPLLSLVLEIVLVCLVPREWSCQGSGAGGRAAFPQGKAPPNSGFPVELSFCAALFSVWSPFSLRM